MLNNNTTQHKVFRYDEIIKLILNNLGVTRTDTSEYVKYMVDGKLLRVRISDHGINLSAWYRNNLGDVIPLNESNNISFTFLPNKEECKERNEEFRTTAINKTAVYSDVNNKTPIDIKFTVIHYVYQSWKFTEERLQALIEKIKEYTISGKFEDPLSNTSAKADVFEDTSNLPPKRINKITENKTYKTMKRYVINKRSDNNDSLLESKIRRVVRDVLNEITVIDKIPNFDRNKAHFKRGDEWGQGKEATDAYYKRGRFMDIPKEETQTTKVLNIKQDDTLRNKKEILIANFLDDMIHLNRNDEFKNYGIENINTSIVWQPQESCDYFFKMRGNGNWINYETMVKVAKIIINRSQIKDYADFEFYKSNFYGDNAMGTYILYVLVFPKYEECDMALNML